MKNAVVTASVGEAFSEMGRITQPLMEVYANRCGAKFVVISEPVLGARQSLPGRYEKFQIHELLNNFERILFLDNDILVVPDAPNLFEQVPEHLFSAVSETAFSRASLDIELTQKVLGSVPWRVPYFNTGVMLIGQSHKALFDPKRSELTAWNDFSSADTRYHPAGEDQAYLNYLVNADQIEFLDLGYQFNHTRVRTDTEQRFRSHFIHYAGPSGFRYGTRLEQMRKDARVLNSPLALRLARAMPVLRWVLDRCDVAFASYLLGRVRGKER